MHCHRFPLILITLCMNKRPTSEVEDLPQLVSALAVQNNSTLPQTKLLLADSLRRFKPNLVQQIAINVDFVHCKKDTVLNCVFSVMQAVHWGIIQSSRQTLQLNIDTTSVQWGTKVEMVAVQKIITMRSTRMLHLPIRSEAGLGHLRARKPNSHLRVFALVHYAFPLALFALHLRLFRGAVQSCNQQEYLFRSGCNCDTSENLRDENGEKT